MLHQFQDDAKNTAQMRVKCSKKPETFLVNQFCTCGLPVLILIEVDVLIIVFVFQLDITDQSLVPFGNLSDEIRRRTGLRHGTCDGEGKNAGRGAPTDEGGFSKSGGNQTQSEREN